MANEYSAKPSNVKNFTQSSEVKLPQDIQDYSEFLPEVNRTESLTRFFGATVNQLLSSGSTQSVDTYWGRLSGRNYNPNSELFNPETDDKRLNYQFQPGVVSRKSGDIQQTTSYVNWLNRIESLGADLDNHDRLFSEPGYVLDLPINSDMLINYRNYYWLEGQIPLIVIEPAADNPIDIDDITALSQYTTALLTNYRSVVFTSGIRVQFTGNNVSSTSGDYEAEAIYYVENVGGRHGIKLIEQVNAAGKTTFPTITPYEIEPREGYDTIDYDTTPWDGSAAFEDYSVSTTTTREDLSLNKSYIVMERFAQDKNPWARSNKWFSIHALRIAAAYNDLEIEAFLNTRTRANRPIIEFQANMELFNTCNNYIDTVDYAVSIEQITDILGGVATYNIDPENELQNDDIILVSNNDPGGIDIVEFNSDFDTNFDSGASSGGAYGPSYSAAFSRGVQTATANNAYIVSGVGTNITISPAVFDPFVADDYVIVAKGTEKGEIYCFDGNTWSLAQTKETRGDAPLFKLYNDELIALNDFDAPDFAGDKIFGYKENATGAFDRELGFTPTFTDQGSFNNYRFEWTLSNTRYNEDVVDNDNHEILGLYYWKDWVNDEHYNGWSNIRGGQRVPVIQTQVAADAADIVFDLGTTDFSQPTEFTISYEDGAYQWHDHSYIDFTPIGYANPDFVWQSGVDYTVNLLIANSTAPIQFVAPIRVPSLSVTGITLAGNAPVEITVASTSDLKGGDDVRFTNIVGTTELNGTTHSITVPNSTTIILTGTDSANYSPWTSGGDIEVFDGHIVLTQVEGTAYTLNIDGDYVYDRIIYENRNDPTQFGEIFINNNNHDRYSIVKNGQRLIKDQDFTQAAAEITVSGCVTDDVIELQYIANTDLVNAVYDVAPVHFYNSDNDAFTDVGYDDLINHLTRQMAAMPGFTGNTAGLNNYHDTFRLNTFDGLIRQQRFRTKNVQHLMDQEDINPIRALKSFALDYANFKKTFGNKVAQLWRTESWSNVRDLVDRALSDINLGKNDTFKYAHSDMLYYKQARTATYNVTTDTTSFALPEVINRYGDTQNHVQVYVEEFVTAEGKIVERPLVKDIEYVVEGPNVELTTAVGTGDVVTIRWYDYKQVSNVPFSAVKLGFFNPTQVEVVGNELIGHDGSRHIITGTNIIDMDDTGFDVVGAALWDFELRIFNNLVDAHFVGDGVIADMADLYPNPHREFSYTVGDVNTRLDDWFNRWAVRNNVDVIDERVYDYNDDFTWNYSSVFPYLGTWRGLYVYTFGTYRPQSHPWEMLGHGVKPTWWDATYSWTAGARRNALNLALLYGKTGNASTPDYVDMRFARPNYDWLNQDLVSSDGLATLNGPLNARVVARPDQTPAAKSYVFGDWGDTENLWRSSSEYLFALAEVFLQLKPYRTHETFWQLANWNRNRNVTQEQWIDPDTCQRQHTTEMHNQQITDGIISKIKVVAPGTGYTELDIAFTPNNTCYGNPSVIAYTNAGNVVGVAVQDPGRGFINSPDVTLTGSLASAGAELEYILDFDFVVTHLGFNTLPAEEYRQIDVYTNKLATRLENLELNYMLHVGGYTDKRIMSIELDGDFASGDIKIPDSSYSILMDRNAPIKTAFYSGVKIEKLDDSSYRVTGYDLDSEFFRYLQPSTAGNAVSIAVGNNDVVKHLNWRNEIARIPYRSTFTKRQELYQFLLGLGKYYESIGFDVFTAWEDDAKQAIAWTLDSAETEPFYVNGIESTLHYEQGDRGVLQTIDVNYDGIANVLDSDFKQIRRSEMLVLRDETKTEIGLKDSTDRIYGIGVKVIEFEHIITIQNTTTFNDPIYQPEIGVGQNRVRLVGERTRNWNGRIEAPGYIVQDRGLVLNIESSVRELEQDWVTAESKALERLTRQTIGYNVGYSKPTYMTNMFISDKSAYNFEKGQRKYKGTSTAIAAMARNKNIFGTAFEHELYEEWMVRLGDFGDVSERNPLQFAIDSNKIKTDPQHFRFNDSFVSDRQEDLIVDLHKGSPDAISGEYATPFDVFDVLRLNNTSIATLNQYQTFTRNAGLPIVTEIDYFLGSIDNIGDIYNPTQEYAFIPNWSETSAYLQGDRIRRFGKVYTLAIATTGITNTQDDIVVRGTQVFPQVANGLTFIANGETVTFAKNSSNITYDGIEVNGTVTNPTVPSGDTLTLNNINVNFIKTETTTTYNDIEIEGNVTNPTIVNSASRELTVKYANNATTPLSTTTVAFDELSPTLTMQQIWFNVFDATTLADPLGETSDRLLALDALRQSYIAANSSAAWGTWLAAYYDATTNPDFYINPEYVGDEVAANIGAAWEADARVLIQLDLDLLTALSGTHTETEATMVLGRGSYNNATTFDDDVLIVNNLLDFNITATDANANLQNFRAFVESNGTSDIVSGTEITVTNPSDYVTDTLVSIGSKITDALALAGAPAGITVSLTGNRINLRRTNNQSGYRLGVSTDANLGFTSADNDVATQGSTVTGPVNLTLAEAVTAINNASITGVSAQAISNRLRLTSTNQSLIIGNSSANNDLGVNAGTVLANTNTTTVPVDLLIGDIVTQINSAAIADLIASQVEGALILTYSNTTLTIGAGTANAELGITANEYDSRTDTVQNVFNASDWTVTLDPAHFNVWTIDNIGSNASTASSTTNRYDVYQTLDFQIGVLEICVGNESGDDALVKTDNPHTLSAGDYVLIVNSTCIPNVDGIHRVTAVAGDNSFFIDRYIQQKGFAGKVLPIRSVRFPNTDVAEAALIDDTYVQGSLGLRTGDYVYIDEILDDNSDGLGYGAVYTVGRTDNAAGLTLVREENGKTDNSKIKNGVLYSDTDGETVIRFEVFDPLKGIIPGIADIEIDLRSDVDYAYYNNSTDPDLETRDENAWGQFQVGTVWWDLRNAIYLNYDQSTPEYRQEQWGQLFPTGSIDIYEWTKSPVTPDEYMSAVQGGTVIDGTELTGVPYAFADQYGELQYNWCEELELNRNTNQIETYYYFWVSDKTTTPTLEREYSVLQLADIVIDPTTQQVDWIAATGENTMLISSLAKSSGYSDLVMQVNFDVNASDYHQEFALLAENDPSLIMPEWLHISLRDSLAGFTQNTNDYEYAVWDSGTTYSPDQIVKSALSEYFRCHTASTNNNPDSDADNNYWTLLELNEDNPDGDYNGIDIARFNEPQSIPDLTLHPSVRYGLETRPHQTWFKSIASARKVVVDKINDQFSNINIVNSDIPWQEEFERSFFVGDLEYDITEYWHFVDWSQDGFAFARGVGDYFVEFYTDLAALSPTEGDIAQVERSVDTDSRERRSVWKYEGAQWNLIYKEKATIKFNDLIWDNDQSDNGWDIVGFDTDQWDKDASAVMVEIFDSFYNSIWIDERRSLYSDLWFHMAKHVLHEQDEVDWFFKSSYFKLIAEDTLEKQYNRYFTENVDDFFDYVGTVKPFHSKMSDAIVRKVADDEYNLASLDTVEIRVQTNPDDSTVNEETTRSFRLHVGTDKSNYSSQIVDANKVLLGSNISSTSTVIPYLNTGDGELAADIGAIWINGERITFTGKTVLDAETALGIATIISGFSSGFSEGFGGVEFLTGVTRGTQGTLARSHSFADIIEDETNYALVENTTLSDYGSTTTGETSDLSPAWNEVGDTLMSQTSGFYVPSTNQNPNGITIRSNGFGTINPYGNIQHAQWLAQQESSDAIASFQLELEELIELMEVEWA
tara:strand:+ start:310 stop:11376 length:11067 start_codon:yes stop_codon:yes gene_type:complete